MSWKEPDYDALLSCKLGVTDVSSDPRHARKFCAVKTERTRLLHRYDNRCGKEVWSQDIEENDDVRETDSDGRFAC